MGITDGFEDSQEGLFNEATLCTLKSRTIDYFSLASEPNLYQETITCPIIKFPWNY